MEKAELPYFSKIDYDIYKFLKNWQQNKTKTQCFISSNDFTGILDTIFVEGLWLCKGRDL